jgi:hypothetical protein
MRYVIASHSSATSSHCEVSTSYVEAEAISMNNTRVLILFTAAMGKGDYFVASLLLRNKGVCVKMEVVSADILALPSIAFEGQTAGKVDFERLTMEKNECHCEESRCFIGTTKQSEPIDNIKADIRHMFRLLRFLRSLAMTGMILWEARQSYIANYSIE